MNAAATIRQARRRDGSTLRELATRARTSHATLSAYEQGRKVPTVDTFLRIVRAAGFEVGFSLTPRLGDLDPAERGAELEAVLHLAAQFPARHETTLRCPPFPQPRGFERP
jgi:transcriptional regulator with XRE-family HTH domain